MALALRHVGIVVRNLEDARYFYCGMLGFQEVRSMDESGAHLDTVLGLEKSYVTTVKLRAPDGGMIELLKFHSHEHYEQRLIYSIGISHIALTVENLDWLYGELVRRGVTFISPPVVSPDGKAKVCFCEDLDDNSIELVEDIKC